MLSSYDAAPKKPEKSTKNDNTRIEKRDSGNANKQKPVNESHKPDQKKKH